MREYVVIQGIFREYLNMKKIVIQGIVDAGVAPRPCFTMSQIVSIT